MIRLGGWLRAFAAVSTFALASCGGGGGGGGGGSGVNVTASASAFQIVSVGYAAGTSNAVTFTMTGGNGQTLYAGATSATPNLVANLQVVSDTQAIVTLTDNSGTAGRTSGTVTFQLCADETCHSVVWSHAYAVTSTRFGVDTTPLTLTGSEGGTTTASVTLTPADTSRVLAVSGYPLNSSIPWLSGTQDSAGNIAVTASAAGLAAGAYPAILYVGTVDNPNMAQVQVVFNVGVGMVAPALADIVERADTTTAGLQGSGAVTIAAGTGAWTATSDKPWLVLDTGTGNGSSSFTYHVDLAAAHAVVSNWKSDTANITITSPGKTTVATTLTYRRQLPEVVLVTPSEVRAGQAATVRLTGRGLSQLTSLSQIQQSGGGTSSGTKDSDTQVTLNLPAQAAGTVQFSIPNGTQSAFAKANLAVVSGSLAYAAVPTSNPKNDIVYDPSRQAIFATDNLGQVLIRWQLVGSTWTLASLPVANVWRVTLSPDRQTLYLLTSSSLVEVNPDTLTIGATHTGAIFDAFSYDEPMPFTLDRRLWIAEASGQYFDLGTGTFANATLAERAPGGGGFRSLEATPDGSHLFTADGDMYSSNGWYNAASQTSTSLPVGVLPNEYRAAFDLDGGLGLFEFQWVYHTDTWTLAGTAALGASEAGAGGVISPDGTRVYRLAGPSYQYNYGGTDHFDVFDTTRLVPGTANFVQIGTIPVPDQAVNYGCAGYYCDNIGRLAIDQLGTTLFWAGDKNLVVIPIPTGMAQPSSVRGGTKLLRPAKSSGPSGR